MDLWYSNWEQQCVEALESEPDYENQLHNEKELYSQQMWTKFQTTASAIAQLYKGDSTFAMMYVFPDFLLYLEMRDGVPESFDDDQSL